MDDAQSIKTLTLFWGHDGGWDPDLTCTIAYPADITDVSKSSKASKGATRRTELKSSKATADNPGLTLKTVFEGAPQAQHSNVTKKSRARKGDRPLASRGGAPI